MSIRRLKVNLSSSPYEVRIGDGAIDKLGATLRQINTSKKAVIIADSEVASLYGPRVRKVLEASDYAVSDLVVPHGESNKNLEVAGELYDALALLGISRDDLIVALGGGVVGDMAGFVAATYMRGLPFVQVPTTLLSMVDASVGGKNAVNLPAGKNLVGTFAQPIHVLIDTDFLASLPQREWICGMGEIAKTAVIGTAQFYDWLCDNVELLVARDQTATQDAIAQCVAFKADVVIHDEHETEGIRECLNYGHTFGHALESLAGYGVLSHGQAVAEGMRFSARLAADVLGTDIDFVLEQDALLDAMGLAAVTESYPALELCEKMYADKKVREGAVRFVLPRSQGDWEVVSVDRATLMTHLNAWQQSKEL